MPCDTLVPMPDDTDAALAHLRRIAAMRRKAADQERPAIVAALQAGHRQAEVARAIDRTREHVRLVWEAWKDAQRTEGIHDATAEPAGDSQDQTRP